MPRCLALLHIQGSQGMFGRILSRLSIKICCPPSSIYSPAVFAVKLTVYFFFSFKFVQ